MICLQCMVVQSHVQQTNNIVDVLRDIELNPSPRDCYIIIVNFYIPTVCTTRLTVQGLTCVVTIECLGCCHQGFNARQCM